MIVVAEVLVIIYDFLNLDTFFLVYSSKQSNGFDCKFRMSSSRGKKAAVPASKKRKEASSSSGPTAEVHHPFLRFPIGPQEELFQILRARPLIAGLCIDWAAVE
ncbi:hypothetical protein PVK06_004586 [Gossypium arboreum]|uniref:Uncharacterized protein n=1 Tax=Gossypium arboreum TaxID=29729 RepID=A0ABR0QSG5_GOSAR|nr:hypothetical protein PVK06_004586 [Gossypium arboreum]